MEVVIARILKDVGIGGIAELRKMGSLEALKVICTKQTTACVNMLYALESVIQGIDMDELPAKQKKELKRKYEQTLKTVEAAARKTPQEGDARVRRQRPGTQAGRRPQGVSRVEGQ